MSEKLIKWLNSANASLALFITIAAGIVYGTTLANKIENTAYELSRAQSRADELHKQLIKTDIETANDLLRLREAVLVMTVNFQYISNQLYKITK